jgi:hypothetical protein
MYIYRLRVGRTDGRTDRRFYTLMCPTGGYAYKPKNKSCFYRLPVRTEYIPHIFPLCSSIMSDKGASDTKSLRNFLQIQFNISLSASYYVRSYAGANTKSICCFNVDLGKMANFIIVYHLHRFLISLSHIADLKHARMHSSHNLILSHNKDPKMITNAALAVQPSHS